MILSLQCGTGLLRKPIRSGYHILRSSVLEKSVYIALGEALVDHLLDHA